MTVSRTTCHNRPGRLRRAAVALLATALLGSYTDRYRALAQAPPPAAGSATVASPASTAAAEPAMRVRQITAGPSLELSPPAHLTAVPAAAAAAHPLTRPSSAETHRLAAPPHSSRRGWANSLRSPHPALAGRPRQPGVMPAEYHLPTTQAGVDAALEPVAYSDSGWRAATSPTPITAPSESAQPSPNVTSVPATPSAPVTESQATGRQATEPQSTGPPSLGPPSPGPQVTEQVRPLGRLSMIQPPAGPPGPPGFATPPAPPGVPGPPGMPVPPGEGPFIQEPAFTPNVAPDSVHPGGAQPPPPVATAQQLPNVSPIPLEVIEHTGELQVMLRRSKLIRTPHDIYRTAVVDPRICNVVQFTPREVSIIGQAQGTTHVTFWFEDGQSRPVTYLVRVVPDIEVQKRREEQYDLFEEILSELFPDSKVHLVPVADKILVKGQARDAEEAAQIMAVVRNQAGGFGMGGGGGGFGGWNGGGWGGGAMLSEGLAAEPLVGQGGDNLARSLPPSQVINMLRIPGVQQVALRVKIAELNRTKARRFGVDLNMRFADGNVLLQSLLNASAGSAATLLGSFDGNQINFGVHYLEQEGVIRLLSEPTLVTLSGRPASFVAGGEFAVPTTVGVGGAAAVTTDFRSFGAIVTFLPVVIDKDRIRLQVSPEFSQVNRQLAVNNIPGLNSRAVTTTVEMREGQTLAIAGLLDDSMNASLSGSVPFLYRLFGLRQLSRSETELIILVTPELVQPMEPEEVPPLPGFDVTEPNNAAFYLQGRLEGRPTLDYRSTVWPRLKQRYRNGGPAMISGPFGHGQ